MLISTERSVVHQCHALVDESTTLTPRGHKLKLENFSTLDPGKPFVFSSPFNLNAQLLELNFRVEVCVLSLAKKVGFRLRGRLAHVVLPIRSAMPSGISDISVQTIL